MENVTKIERRPVAARSNTPAIDDKVITGEKIAINYSEISNAVADKRISELRLGKNITAIRERGLSLRQFVQETAVGIAMHFVQHGDFTKLNELRSAIKDTISPNQANSFVTWCVSFMPLKFAAGKFEKISNKMPNSFCGMTKKDFDANKIEAYVNPRGVDYHNYYSKEVVIEKPASVDFLVRLAQIVTEANKLAVQNRDGVVVEKTKADNTKLVKKFTGKQLNHKHVDEKVASDLLKFATSHGLDASWVKSEIGKDDFAITVPKAQ